MRQTGEKFFAPINGSDNGELKHGQSEGYVLHFFYNFNMSIYGEIELILVDF